MDSRLLYKATEALSHKLDWHNSGTEEWIHFGTGERVNRNLVTIKISEHLGNEDIYLVFESTNSGPLTNPETEKLFNRILGNNSFFLWNAQLDKAIEFNRIGTLRLGTLTPK